ncbi:MAG: hypothetical protein U0457_05375 [Candidatus Sericytochromatia bacterium]
MQQQNLPDYTHKEVYYSFDSDDNGNGIYGQIISNESNRTR